MLTRSRLLFLGIVAVFVAPPVLALVFYAGVGSWFDPGTVSRGSLIDPPRPAPRAPLVLVNGGVLPADHLDRRWTIVHLARDGCRRACEEALQAMRLAHRALGRNRTRVQRLLLLPAASPPSVEADCPVARVTPAWDRALRESDRDEGTGTAGIWLVGPAPFRDLAFSGRRRTKDDRAGPQPAPQAVEVADGVARGMQPSRIPVPRARIAGVMAVRCRTRAAELEGRLLSRLPPASSGARTGAGAPRIAPATTGPADAGAERSPAGALDGRACLRGGSCSAPGCGSPSGARMSGLARLLRADGRRSGGILARRLHRWGKGVARDGAPVRRGDARDRDPSPRRRRGSQPAADGRGRTGRTCHRAPGTGRFPGRPRGVGRSPCGLQPAVVVAHLLGGMAVLGLLWRIHLGGPPLLPDAPPPEWLGPAAAVGVMILAVQIALGGWTSANYAALACPDFPHLSRRLVAGGELFGRLSAVAGIALRIRRGGCLPGMRASPSTSCIESGRSSPLRTWGCSAGRAMRCGRAQPAAHGRDPFRAGAARHPGGARCDERVASIAAWRSRRP